MYTSHTDTKTASRS